MDNEKSREEKGTPSRDANLPVDNSMRARNRTVMLTPDMTSQVRAQLAAPEESSEEQQIEDRPFVSQKRSPVMPEETEGDSEILADDSGSDDNEWTRPISTPESVEASAMGRLGEWEAPKATGSMNEVEQEAFTPPPSRASNTEYVSHEVNVKSHSQNTQRTAAAATSKHEEVYWKTLSPISGFLVTFDHNPMGEYVELRSGRMIVSSERETASNHLFINDKSVSPMHAIVKIAPGEEIQILDQLSESGTKIIRSSSGEEETLAGDKSVLRHGDSVVFGTRTYQLCLMLAPANENK